MGTIFVAGAYGVGKSTLCDILSRGMNVPAYSAGDLISKVNGEKYGANKAVQDKDNNQDILACVVAEKLKQEAKIILAGHFCIFDAHNRVDKLPSSVFEKLQIEKILLLEADIERIIDNLNNRDGKQYTKEQIAALLVEEHSVARKVANAIGCPLYIHKMNFNDSDAEQCSEMWRRE